MFAFGVFGTGLFFVGGTAIGKCLVQGVMGFVHDVLLGFLFVQNVLDKRLAGLAKNRLDRHGVLYRKTMNHKAYQHFYYERVTKKKRRKKHGR